MYNQNQKALRYFHDSRVFLNPCPLFESEVGEGCCFCHASFYSEGLSRKSCHLGLDAALCFSPSFSRAACVPPGWRRQLLVLPWCERSGAGTTHRLRPQPRWSRAGDGVARRGAATHPQAGSRQERRGGEEEPAHGVQVGIPHSVLSSDREDETASDGRFIYLRVACLRLACEAAAPDCIWRLFKNMIS